MIVKILKPYFFICWAHACSTGNTFFSIDIPMFDGWFMLVYGFLFFYKYLCSVRLDPNYCWLLDSYFDVVSECLMVEPEPLLVMCIFFAKSICSMIKSVLSVCSTQKDAEMCQFIYHHFRMGFYMIWPYLTNSIQIHFILPSGKLT